MNLVLVVPNFLCSHPSLFGDNSRHIHYKMKPKSEVVQTKHFQCSAMIVYRIVVVSKVF